jgi:N-acetylglucosaminyl-diphospho-decaprenol L-rhamnosyltransferase
VRSAERPTVSITVVAYNSDHCLRECLSSVRGTVLEGFAEVVVVDNASPDQSARMVAEEFPEATLVRSEINRGFAGGCNLAWPLVHGRYWLLLNPDVVVPAAGLERLVEWMDAHPGLGAGSPLLATAQGRVEFVGRRAPSLSLTILEASRLHLLIPRGRRAELFLGPYWVARRGHLSVDWVPGTAMIVRREAVEAAGLLSEGVPMYGEDAEWCWRMRKAGWRIGVCGALSFRHDEGQSAIRTWGETERSWRMWHGMYTACARIRGTTYCRLLMAANALAFVIDAHHPRRSPGERAQSRRHLCMHMALLRGRIPAGVPRSRDIFAVK